MAALLWNTALEIRQLYQKGLNGESLIE